MKYLLNIFTQPLHYQKDVTQGQILSKVKLVVIQHFPFSGLVT